MANVRGIGRPDIVIWVMEDQSGWSGSGVIGVVEYAAENLVEVRLSPGRILGFWVVLVLLLQGVQWLAGFRPVSLTEAVEEGAARVESQVIGEVGEDVIRKAIQTQRATRSFWSAVAILTDFGIEPLSLVVRAALATLVFASLAAIRGRKVDLERGFYDASLAQGFWVLALAVRVALMIALRRSDVETSLVLALPPGKYAGATWVALRQVDVFAALGWWVIGSAAVRHKQVGWIGAVFVCLTLWCCEAALRVGADLVMEAGMRLSVMPDS